MDPIRIGEFNVVFASLVAWLGIGLVAILATLVPERAGKRVREQITTEVRRVPKHDQPAATAAPGPEPQAR